MKNEQYGKDLTSFQLFQETSRMVTSSETSREIIKSIQLNLTLYHRIDFQTFLRIFEKTRNAFYQVLIQLDLKTIFTFLDEDKDGVLSEDEILMIFSLIKSKLCHLNQELICEGFYKESTQIKNQISSMSGIIFDFQTFLRQRLYKTQLEKLDAIIGKARPGSLTFRGSVGQLERALERSTGQFRQLYDQARAGVEFEAASKGSQDGEKGEGQGRFVQDQGAFGHEGHAASRKTFGQSREMGRGHKQ